MTAGERGFLLLSSHLGDPRRKCLTAAQFRQLAQRVQNAPPHRDMREITPKDLLCLGYGAEEAQRIVSLLEQEPLLDAYLAKCEKAGCGVLTRISEGYPHRLRLTLGPDAPASLWYKGDLSILEDPKVALVGSRDIQPENAQFAREVGIQAAKQGFALISGNARGADRIAQQACLEAGGRVISVLADALTEHPERENMLLLSEDGFDVPFSTPRALSRNRVIHALSPLTLVAQCAVETGGTWDGTARNLRHGWSKVCCFNNGSESAAHLEQMGAELIRTRQLSNFPMLTEQSTNLFEYI